MYVTNSMETLRYFNYFYKMIEEFLEVKVLKFKSVPRLLPVPANQNIWQVWLKR